MMPRKDPGAKREYHTEYMRKRMNSDPVFKEKHRKRVRANDAKKRAAIDVLVDEFRLKGCASCPEKEPCCLVAHHTDPEAKDFNIGDARRHRYRTDRVRAELEKCVCLCMNCHAKVHAGIVTDG